MVARLPALKKGFHILGKEIMKLQTKIDKIKTKTGDFDQKWFMV